MEDKSRENVTEEGLEGLDNMEGWTPGLWASIDQPQSGGAFLAKQVVQGIVTAACTVGAIKVVDWYKERKEQREEEVKRFRVAGN